jgi:hypothetical protein
MNDSVRQLARGGVGDAHTPPAARTPHGARASSAMRRGLFVLPLTSVVFAVSAAWRVSELPGLVLCPFRAVTGLPCPGCGMTRAFCSIGHGEFTRAFGYNALAPFVFVAAMLVWAHALATVLKLDTARAALERLRPGTRLTRVMLAVVLVWWVVRLCGGF